MLSSGFPSLFEYMNFVLCSFRSYTLSAHTQDNAIYTHTAEYIHRMAIQCIFWGFYSARSPAGRATAATRPHLAQRCCTSPRKPLSIIRLTAEIPKASSCIVIKMMPNVWKPSFSNSVWGTCIYRRSHMRDEENACGFSAVFLFFFLILSA